MEKKTLLVYFALQAIWSILYKKISKKAKQLKIINYKVVPIRVLWHECLECHVTLKIGLADPAPALARAWTSGPRFSETGDTHNFELDELELYERSCHKLGLGWGCSKTHCHLCL